MNNTSNSIQQSTINNVQCQQSNVTDTNTSSNNESCSNELESIGNIVQPVTELPSAADSSDTTQNNNNNTPTSSSVIAKSNVVDLPPPPSSSASPATPSSPSPTPHRRRSSICPEIQVSNSDNSEVKKVYTFTEQEEEDEEKLDEDNHNQLLFEENVEICKRLQCTETLSCQCCRASEDKLNSVIKELKKKIEYTEKMNWLCMANRPTGPPHRKTSLPKHIDVKNKFLEICDNTLSDEVKAALRLPAFDSYEWDDEDVLHLMQSMFVEAGLLRKFNIPITTLREWLYEVYKHYNTVPFHNFRHCFCVAQMMYAMAWHTNLFSRLGDLEVLILLVSCICHDLDHPGYNNIYQINARTELALRYNDISPLENHHCSIAFRLLEIPECNIFKHFSKEQFKKIREGIIRCILATDMARHNEIVSQFQEITPTFDYTNPGHINLLCMILIKVADISNEARPMDIAEPWLERLLQEFFAQSALEKSEGLPVTPFMDPDKVSKPGSQVRFIGLVLLPLFEALGELLPELVEFIINPVRVALDYYKRLNDAQNKSRKSLVEGFDGASEGGSPQMPRSQSGISVRSRRSIPSQKSTSRTSVDEPLCISAELHDLPEDSESGDSETATEVDVAEKASKFKIDTEGNNRPKCSQPSSRKGSKEKRPSMISEMYTTSSGSRSRNSYGNIHGHYGHRSLFGVNRAVSLDQYSRRLSDGVQSTAHDETMVYNRQHRSLDNDGIGFNLADRQLFKAIPEAIKISIDCDNANDPATENLEDTKIISTITSTSVSTPKSLMSRLRQFTDRLGLTFDKDAKRSNSTANIIISAKNNNAETSKIGFCCSTNRNSAAVAVTAPVAVAQNPSETVTTINARNRAMSLDVPIRTQYSCSSSGGDSRKSSRNDDSNQMCEDNNSNHTISENKSNVDFGTENGRTSSI